MKTLSKIIVALVALLSVTFTSDAQWISKWSGEQTTTYNGGTNTASALTTNRYFTIDVPKAGGDLAVYVNYSYPVTLASGDGPMLMKFYRGIDAGKFETNAYLTWSIPTNTVLFTTPISVFLTTNVSGIPYLRAHICNPSTNATGRSTNLYVSYGFKN